MNVGILKQGEIDFAFLGSYKTGDIVTEGHHTARCCNGMVEWNGKKAKEWVFCPLRETGTFVLNDVMIGIDFHWERREPQSFKGELHLLAHGDKIIAINRVHIEDYLTSVIGSEMKATASLEFLKASAIISRSWLLRQMVNRMHPKATSQEGRMDSPEEIITWHDQADHDLFDVCADDHCQRYQGTAMVNKKAEQAIEETRGMVLTDQDNDICDARFYKCCGGVTEEYSTCWENQHYGYLAATRDVMPEEATPTDLSVETAAEQWIRSNPEALCNTTDKEILSQVLNSYDIETMDFYRWKVVYSQEQLQELLKVGIERYLGDIVDLVPLARGKSGRIYRLRIVGTEKSYTIGKELEIRRVLSPSHLYSSAFVVDKGEVKNGVPQTFTLTGAGWGHGVGMCQIGAAVMGAKGFNYKDILLHYYHGAVIEKIY